MYNINMSSNLPTTLEYIPLAPEDAEIANTYLETMDITATAIKLNLNLHRVTEYINKPIVQKYITEVFMDTGYRNRLKLGKLLDDIIEKKLEEMSESGLGSSQDIMEILKTVAKIRKDEMELQIKLEDLKSGRPKRQTNIQINNPKGNPYSEFTTKLLDLDELN